MKTVVVIHVYPAMAGKLYKGIFVTSFRAKEMLGATLASIHNLYFIVNLVKRCDNLFWTILF